MKIAFVTDSYIPIPNGVAVSIESLRVTLERLGHNVYIFAPDYPGWSVKEKNIIRLPALFSPLNNTIPVKWPFLGLNQKKVQDLDIDIVHSHYFFKLFPLAIDIAKYSSAPLIHSFYRLFDRDINIKYARECSRIIALSKKSKKDLLDMGIAEEINVLPVGIFTKDYASYPPKVVKSRFQIPEQRKILLYVSRLDNESEFIFLLKAFKNIWRAVEDVHLLVVGGGDKLKYYFELTQKQPFAKYITFTGFLPKKRLNKIFGACYLSVYPKRTDPEPLVLIESMAAGTPVVATVGQGAQDFVDDHKTGFITKATVEDFSDKIIELLRREGLYLKFKHASRSHAKRFSTSILTRDLLELYEQEITSAKNKF